MRKLATRSSFLGWPGVFAAKLLISLAYQEPASWRSRELESWRAGVLACSHAGKLDSSRAGGHLACEPVAPGAGPPGRAGRWRRAARPSGRPAKVERNRASGAAQGRPDTVPRFVSCALEWPATCCAPEVMQQALGAGSSGGQLYPRPPGRPAVGRRENSHTHTHGRPALEWAAGRQTRRQAAGPLPARRAPRARVARREDIICKPIRRKWWWPSKCGPACT